MSKLETIPAGVLFTATTGCYSDYIVRGVFRSLQELDPNALRDEYLQLYPEQATKYRFRDEQFLTWVTRKGLIEIVDCWEWHLEDYSTVQDMWTGKVDNHVQAS